jgi:flagellar protein FlgJ
MRRPPDGLLDSEQSRFFTTIGDQQMAQDLASQAPLGFAAMIEKQLADRSTGASAARRAVSVRCLAQSLLSRVRDEARPPMVADRPARSRTIGVTNGREARPAPHRVRAAFVDRVWPHAVEAAALTGMPAHFLVAQSALESGWGKREIRTADGSPSFNLFGIKAGRRWSGPTVEVQTTEFVNGVAQNPRAQDSAPMAPMPRPFATMRGC